MRGMIRFIAEATALASRGTLDWFFNRFTASNNFRLGMLWAGVLAVLLFNLLVFGFGPALEFGRPEEVQRQYNGFRYGRAVTDAELVSYGSALFGGLASAFGWFWGWMRWLAWLGWLVLLALALIYVPVAFRDEASRAWRAVSRAARERRAGRGGAGAAAPGATTGAAGAPASADRPLTFREFLRWETISSVFWEFLGQIVFHRGR